MARGDVTDIIEGLTGVRHLGTRGGRRLAIRRVEWDTSGLLLAETFATVGELLVRMETRPPIERWQPTKP